MKREIGILSRAMNNFSEAILKSLRNISPIENSIVNCDIIEPRESDYPYPHHSQFSKKRKRRW